MNMVPYMAKLMNRKILVVESGKLLFMENFCGNMLIDYRFLLLIDKAIDYRVT